MFNLAEYKLESGKYMAVAWPGAYPLYYITADGGVLCPKCVNEEYKIIEQEQIDKDNKQWLIVGVEINYEHNNLYCDHCYDQIKSAYGESDE